MKTATAKLNNWRQAPRKVRLVVNAVRGKKVSEAIINLDFLPKRASKPIKDLLLSALANARNLEIPTDNLVVKTIQVNGGGILYRRRPASRGSAHPIRKRTSHIFVELAEKEEVKKAKKSKPIKSSIKNKK